MTVRQCEVAIVGSGFAGSLLARILATLGYDVVLVERGAHPRFALGESSTPMANLTLERLGARYGLGDCRDLAAHGRWASRHPQLMRGLKRGFTYYRHHAGESFADRGLESERLLVAASPDDGISDTHWLRADVDHHFVREAVAAGVDYRDRVELTDVTFDSDGSQLEGRDMDGAPLSIHARFVIDASGAGGFLARALAIPSSLHRTETRSGLVYSHFDDVRLMSDVVPDLPAGPYPDDWAAVHHIIDEGWIYSLRFDDGVTSAGILLSPRGTQSFDAGARADPTKMWSTIVGRYPTIAAVFADARPHFPLRYHASIQHRLSRATGPRWAMLPHAYAFVDPLFSTGIACGLRGVERLALAFEDASDGARVPNEETLTRYDGLLAAEADQIDRLVAGAYDAMAHFDLFAAHAMIYFALVSFGEIKQRLSPGESWAWSGFLGAGDASCESLVVDSRSSLKEIASSPGDADQRNAYVDWVASAIAPRNVAGLADPSRHNLYPVDLDVLVDRHALLGMSRADLIAKLPLLRGTGAPA